MKTKIICVAIAVLFLFTGMAIAHRNIESITAKDISINNIKHRVFPDDFTFRKPITVTDQENNGYQLNFEVGFNSGDINCCGHCNADFSDLVFTQSDETVIPHWIEEVDDGNRCMVWVNNLNNDDTIYINYGCPFAIDSSDGEATFPVHFEDWSTDNTGDYTQNAGGNPTDRKWSTPIDDCSHDYKCRYRLNQQTHKYATGHGNTMSIGVSETQSRDYLGAYFQFCDQYNFGASWQLSNCAVQSYVNDGATNEAGGWYTVHTDWNVYEISTTPSSTILNQYTDAFEGLMHSELSTVSNTNIGYVSYHGDFAYGCESSGDINTFTWDSNGYARMYMWASNWWYDYNSETILIDYMFVAENQAIEPTLVSGAEESISHEVRGDINEDGYVNFADLLIFHQAWLANTSSLNWDERCDFNSDGYVDSIDLQVMEDDWLGGYENIGITSDFDYVWFCLLNDLPHGWPHY